MGLDIRWPIGLMFALIGALLTGFGAIKAADSISLGLNINLIWGVILLLFGAGMLIGAIRDSKKTQ
jgi:hypothetical protein